MCVDTARVGEEEVTYTLDDAGYVDRLGKGLAGGLGEAIGINYVSAADKPVLVRHLEDCADQDYFERGLETAIARDELRSSRWTSRAGSPSRSTSSATSRGPTPS